MSDSSLPTPTPPSSPKLDNPVVPPQSGGIMNQPKTIFNSPTQQPPFSRPVVGGEDIVSSQAKPITPLISPVQPQQIGNSPLNIPRVPLQSPIPQAKTPAPEMSAPQADVSEKKGPIFAQVKKLSSKTVMFVLGGVLLLVALGFFAYSMFGGGGDKTQSAKTSSQAETTQAVQQVTITYWGLWEPSEVLSQVIADFESANPGVKIDYRKQSHVDYRERLQTALASGNGPDVFRYHASWVPMLTNELATLPTKIMTAQEFQSTFYPAAVSQLQVGGKIYGIPLMYDGLALFYNKSILKTAGANPPTTWAELSRLADGLTVPSNASERKNSDIVRGGIAMGLASNVEHFSDIIALLILQNGGDPNTPTSAEVRDALLFYTKFAKDDKVWGSNLPSSTIAFAREEAAMMIAPSWRALEVKNMNPSLDFGITSVPQLSESKVAWASYWAEGVNSKGKNQEVAWNFIKFLATKENLRKFYSDASQVRAFGEIYPRVDMASELANKDYVSAYLSDAPYAKGWYLSSYTHDNGVNDKLIKYYTDAVNSINSGTNIDDVLLILDQGTKQVLKQYSITSTTK